jgi:uncharacterized integral membrane protein
VLNRIAWLLVGFPALLLLVTLAVSNRHTVRLVLDPFRPEAPVLSLSMPFYYYLFASLLLGALIGGMVMWFGQGQWRRRARNRGQDAVRWQAEAERLQRERDADVMASAGGGSPTRKQLTVVRR